MPSEGGSAADASLVSTLPTHDPLARVAQFRAGHPGHGWCSSRTVCVARLVSTGHGSRATKGEGAGSWDQAPRAHGPRPRRCRSAARLVVRGPPYVDSSAHGSKTGHGRQRAVGRAPQAVQLRCRGQAFAEARRALAAETGDAKLQLLLKVAFKVIHSQAFSIATELIAAWRRENRLKSVVRRWAWGGA